MSYFWSQPDICITPCLRGKPSELCDQLPLRQEAQLDVTSMKNAAVRPEGEPPPSSAASPTVQVKKALPLAATLKAGYTYSQLAAQQLR